jgi:hypothetical protein
MFVEILLLLPFSKFNQNILILLVKKRRSY